MEGDIQKDNLEKKKNGDMGSSYSHQKTEIVIAEIIKQSES